MGVLFQSGALWSSMTLAENIGLPLEEYTDLNPAEIREVASLKLALVGLKGFEDYYPSRDQRRHAEARRPGPGHGAGSRDAFLRRAFGGPRSDQLAPARRFDSRAGTYGGFDTPPTGGISVAFVAKYDSAGTRVWLRQTPLNASHVSAVAVNPRGDVFVSGRSDDSVDGQPGLGEDDIFVMKFSTDGVKY